jgi:cell division protein FtsI (penicillin-binding protein 3)
LAISLWVLAIVGRLVYLQTAARPSLQERAELQHQQSMKVDPIRGTIFDRNGRALAVSAEVESVYAVPANIEDAEKVARSLASCLGGNPAKLAKGLTSGKRFVWVKRKVDLTEANCVRNLELSGISYLPENRRFYPKRTIASHVLGYVGMDNNGLSGVEYALESEIRGEPGRQIILTDARKRRTASRVEKSPLPGRDVYLTIDETLQHFAETRLERAVRQSGSKRGTFLLMSTQTGEILAMASVPGFNPNRYDDYPETYWRNRAVTDTYEPGSTFKIIPAAAALEEAVTTEEERIDCGRGSIVVGERLIRDHKVFDFLTFREVIELSSNVGMIRISQRLGKQRLGEYVRNFGFGQPTGLELPGESRGILRPVTRWGPRTLASIAFGQEIGVTPLQMITATNAVAASGYLMRPRLIREIRSPDGEVLEHFEPEPLRRVVSRETAARLTELLIGVVDRGTGVRATIPGFRVAGKTGTAEKAVPGGGYSDTDYIASFVGFVPARRPELTALVILDSPTGDHTGARAAGVFAEIVEPSLHYLGVAPEERREGAPLVARWPEQPSLTKRGESTWLDASYGANLEGDEIRVPALYGLSARDAVARVVSLRLVPEIYGSGWIVGQEPPAGTRVAPGTPCTLILGLRGATRFEEIAKIAGDRGETDRTISFPTNQPVAGGDFP